MKAKEYVVLPWTDEEEQDYQRFCESIGEVPNDPAHAALMEDGEIDFFNLDEWWDVDLPRA